MKKSPWNIIKEKTIYSSGVVSLKELDCQHRERDFNYTFKVLESGDWVNIVPITRDQEVVMVRQHRAGTQEYTLEIPGGGVDKKDAGPMQAALRELTEETGYVASSAALIGQVTPNPALFSNRSYTFLAQDVRLEYKPNLDPAEDIEIELVPLAQINQLIRDGSIHHALVVSAFHFLHLNSKISEQSNA